MVAMPDDGLTAPPPLPAKGLAPKPPAAAPVQQASYRPNHEQAPAKADGPPLVVSAGPAPTAAANAGTHVSVETMGPASVAPGEPIHFEMLVRNTGGVAAAAVRIEAPLPPGTKLLQAEPAAENTGDPLVWNVGNLDAGGERHIKLDLQNDGLDDVSLRPAVAFTSAVGARVRMARPPFAVTQLAPEAAQRGGTVRIQIQVSNNGAAPVRKVVVRDTLPAGLQHPQGDLIEAEIDALAPGETRTLPLEVTAVRAGRFLNVVEATAEGGLHVESRRPIQIADAALALRLAGPRQATVGAEVEYRLEATNPGLDRVSGVHLTLAVPDGMDLLSSNGGAYDASARRVVWPNGELAAGQSTTATVKLKAKAPGDWACQATAWADRLGESRTNQTVHIDAGVELRVEASASPEGVDLGGQAVVTVRVTNLGAAPATNLRITTTAAEGLAVERVEGPTPGRTTGSQAQFDLLPQLGPRQVAVYKILLRGMRTGDLPLKAELNADQSPRPLLAQTTVRVAAGKAAPGPRPAP
jgi:uncharacterized repeat protein (TIGR01451 family)